jgi:hypothetical protein
VRMRRAHDEAEKLRSELRGVGDCFTSLVLAFLLGRVCQALQFCWLCHRICSFSICGKAASVLTKWRLSGRNNTGSSDHPRLCWRAARLVASTTFLTASLPFLLCSRFSSRQFALLWWCTLCMATFVHVGLPISGKMQHESMPLRYRDKTAAPFSHVTSPISRKHLCYFCVVMTGTWFP